ncbi:MAG: hypothetical protein ACK5YA_00815, partial [bacterium]
KFTYVNLDEFIEKNKEVSNYNKIERKEYSKSATSNPNTNIMMNRVKGTAVLLNNSKSNIYAKKETVGGATTSRGTVEINNTNNNSILNGVTKQVNNIGVRSASNNKESVLNEKNSELIGNKSLRSKIKVTNTPGSSSMINFEQKSAILANHVNIDLNSNNNFNSNVNSNNPGSTSNRNSSQFKERKIIGGVASSIIFDDNKLNRSTVKIQDNNISSIRSNSNLGSSISNNNYGQSGVINFNSNNNSNNIISSNTNNFIKSSVILNHNQGSLQKNYVQSSVSINNINALNNNNSNSNNVNSKLPEIESKLEKMKKISGNSLASTGLYSSRGYGGTSGLGNSTNSILLSGISKKITPTKVINPSNLSNNNITQKKIGLSGNTGVTNQMSSQKLSNYSSINTNNKRDLTSPLHYLTHREGSNK